MPSIEVVQGLPQLKQAFIQRNSMQLKELAREFAKQALQFNDKQFAKLSIVCFAVAKLMEKPYIVNSNQWKKFEADFLQHIEEANACASRGEDCTASLEDIVKDTNTLSASLGRFVMSTIEKAQIKAATEIYAHGASVGAAVELTGADRVELLSYIAATRLPEKYQSKSVKERMSLGNKIFK